ncbi:hypothetical protein P3L10_033678 [Capsicum annuum]
MKFNNNQIILLALLCASLFLASALLVDKTKAANEGQLNVEKQGHGGGHHGGGGHGGGGHGGGGHGGGGHGGGGHGGGGHGGGHHGGGGHEK